MYRFYRSIGFIIAVLIGTVTLCTAMDDMSADTGRHLVVIENNELYQNSLVGIRIRGRTPVAIKKSRVYSNGMAGIAIDREAKVTVVGCDISQNGRGGINVGEAAPTGAENATEQKDRAASVRTSRSREKETQASEVQIVNNTIYMNDEAGIRSMPQDDSKVDLRVVGNDIYKNGKAGVRVENNTKLTAKGNNIHDNGTLGIATLESDIPPELDIYQNRVSFNGGPGIHVVNGITGEIGIRNNWVYNNQRSGIACGLVGDPSSKLLSLQIINNTIVSNGSGGQGAGIRNDSMGKVMIMNNVVAYNFVTGIMTRGCRGYSHNLLFANGPIGQVSENMDSGLDWDEVLQYAGCLERGKGDLINDPLFVNPDHYNFYLKDESPAIDAGNKMSIYNDVFFPPSKGTNRNDMGATGGRYAIE